eukprot:6157697-Amphidinium_carterae.7
MPLKRNKAPLKKPPPPRPPAAEAEADDDDTDNDDNDGLEDIDDDGGTRKKQGLTKRRRHEFSSETQVASWTRFGLLEKIEHTARRVRRREAPPPWREDGVADEGLHEEATDVVLEQVPVQDVVAMAEELWQRWTAEAVHMAERVQPEAVPHACPVPRPPLHDCAAGQLCMHPPPMARPCRVPPPPPAPMHAMQLRAPATTVHGPAMAAQ